MKNRCNVLLLWRPNKEPSRSKKKNTQFFAAPLNYMYNEAQFFICLYSDKSKLYLSTSNTIRQQKEQDHCNHDLILLLSLPHNNISESVVLMKTTFLWKVKWLWEKQHSRSSAQNFCSYYSDATFSGKSSGSTVTQQLFTQATSLLS